MSTAGQHGLPLLTFIGAVLAMAIKDCLATLLVVAETRGRAKLSALLDGGLDLANILVVTLGAGSVITEGVTLSSAGVVAAMIATSVVGTYFWTGMAQRIQVSDAHVR